VEDTAVGLQPQQQADVPSGPQSLGNQQTNIVNGCECFTFHKQVLAEVRELTPERVNAAIAELLEGVEFVVVVAGALE
jgi:hypothetical protein